MKNIFLTFLIITSAMSLADDYETAQRFKEGDTISADVLNDILDRIELALITPKSSDFVGTWDIEQTTTVSGCLGNGGNCSLTGRQSPVDNIYSQRFDTVTFKNDGDGTFSLETEKYCSFKQGSQNSSCNIPFAVIDGRFLISDGGTRYAYNVEKISSSRFILSVWATGSSSFNIIQLDKNSLPPKAPEELSITLSSGKTSLSWTAGDTSETGYDVQRKSSSDGNFASIGTPSSESYEDSTIAIGNSYWYRVFAKNSNGTSVGSNVIQISYLNTPPSMNLSSTISVNEGVTEVIDVGASDADDDSLSYSLGSQDPSNDASDFSISSSGVITFNTAPDWENPSDYNTDNVYTINVSVSDGIETVKQDLSIVVQNIDD